MQCENFIYYLGAPLVMSESSYIPSDIASEFNLYLRSINQIISFLLFLFFIFGFLILRFCFRRFYQEKIANMLENSIFSFLADLDEDGIFNSETSDQSPQKMPQSPKLNLHKTVNSVFDLRSTSHPSFEMNEMLMLHREIETSFRKYDETPVQKKESREIYICDFHECCCECCCEFWLQTIYNNHVRSWMRQAWRKLQVFFLKEIKSFCFYSLMIGAFIYHPMKNIGAFMVNVCNNKMIENQSLFYLIEIFFALLDLLCGSLTVIIFLFTLSFLGTRSEFLKTYLFDKGYRARMIYFHLKKAKMFGVLYIIFRIVYKSAFFYDYPMSDANYSSYSLVFVIFINSFLLSIVEPFSGFKIMPIDQDCRILRGHSQYFAIQNNLLKYTPQANDIYKFLKKRARKVKSKFSLLTAFEMRLHKKGVVLAKELKEELIIIEAQKFKNVTKNKGYARYLPVLLYFFMVADLVFTLICSFILLYRSCYPQTNMHNLAHCAQIGFSFISLFECTTMPVMMFWCLKKKTILNATNFRQT